MTFEEELGTSESEALVTLWKSLDVDRDSFSHKYLGNWDIPSNSVFSRDRIASWLSRGEINEKEARILLDLTYDNDRSRY